MTRRWQTHTFDSAPIEIIDGDRGKEYPKQDEFFDDGYCLFLDAGNVTRDGFDFSECHFISEQKDQAKNSQTQAEVKVLVLDSLWQSLPRPPFTEEETQELADRVYDYVWQRGASGEAWGAEAR